jgi:hypothetical protein
MSVLAELIAAGVVVEALAGGTLRASGNLTDDIDALIRAHKHEILAELETHYRWWVVLPERAFEVRIVPQPTQAQVEALYPGARIEPLPDTMH